MCIDNTIQRYPAIEASCDKVMFFFCLQRDLCTEGTKKRRQSTEGEEGGEGERRPLKLARAHQETLRTGKVYTRTHTETLAPCNDHCTETKRKVFIDHYCSYGCIVVST